MMAATATPALVAPSPMQQMGRAKGSARLAVEEALMKSSAAQPITSERIAAITGLPHHLVRTHINNAIQSNDAHNTCPGRRPALYAPGPAPSIRLAVQAQPFSRGEYRARHAKDYDGADLRPFEGRPGAMVAFTLPSLIDGVRHERMAPRLISSRLKDERKSAR